MKIKILTLCIVFALNLTSDAKQSINYSNCRVLKSTDEFIKVLDSIVTAKYYIDSTDFIDIGFNIKIDSTGEIQSVHIVNSKNLTESCMSIYQICNAIENKFSLPFMYMKFKDKLKNYAYFSILFKNNLNKKCNKNK
ncbi:MAG: hypothetical protein IPK18_09865 [Sphingobacteriales bacterium]|nr:MAG: hypothetical protein IPK18_09865 [Sphingobacteriales bacterium]